MKRSSDLRSSLVARIFSFRCSAVFVVTLFVLVSGVPLYAVQVRVPNGTLVRVRLHYDLTTENVEKGDRVEFDVAENVTVNNRVVIPRGAVAWGRVVKVKGAGKKKAKDASVTFSFVGVRTADNQEIPLRMMPTKPKKSNPEDNQIEVDSPIPGLRERMIGAEKGREFAAYTDLDTLINAPDTTPAPDRATPPTSGGTGQSPFANPITPTTPSGQNPPGLLGLDLASINFDSTPSGADILIDGNFVGNTPSTLRVAPGRHIIEIRLSGHRSWSRTMVVDSGSHPSIRAPLEKE